MLAKRSLIKEDKSIIITLGAKAKEAKKKNPNVIDATIGMLYDENGKLFAFKSVEKAMNELSTEEKFAYSSTPGSDEYHEALKKWVFRERYDEMLSKMYCNVIATPGGSGAISNTFANYLNPNDIVLLPEYMWANYKQFAYESFASYETYKMFKDDHFDLDALYNQILDIKKRQGRVVLVINDPCHNPTGYTMSKEEWIRLVDIINEVSKDGTPFILLYDMAYIDYDERGFEATRNNILLFKQFNESVLTVLAFSGSKTLALYGLRIGAQIALSKNKEVIDEFFQANKFSSRAKWSTASTMGMSIISKVFLDNDLRKSFEEELEISRKTLNERAKVFLNETLKVGLKTLPFVGGFFVTIPCDNPNEVYEKLVKKDVHIIPLSNTIRVTLSSINLEECRRLPELIKSVL